ncbi:MAG: hypothetical protein LUC85_02760 [Bacteroidales bacterium]|nr:hypothetical protein [Bacteroidales bacterium]MCD8393739.1 hypothetical protein [Bacteroidales bacterium]
MVFCKVPKKRIHAALGRGITVIWIAFGFADGFLLSAQERAVEAPDSVKLENLGTETPQQPFGTNTIESFTAAYEYFGPSAKTSLSVNPSVFSLPELYPMPRNVSGYTTMVSLPGLMGIGVGGTVSFDISRAFSITLFGSYASNAWAANPAVMSNMGSPGRCGA